MAANVKKIVDLIIKGDSRGAEASMSKLGRGMSGLLKTASALGIAMSAGAFVAITKRSLDTADAIAKQSAQANIASDTYQELVFALDKFDITQEAVAKGLKTFTKQLGEARLGTGTLVTILGKYDKALLNNITSVGSNEAALNIYLKALGNVKSDADRAALSAAGFGRTAGVDMANALKDGGKGLDDWRKKARDLGIIIDDDLLKGAEGAKDQLSALSTVLNVRLTDAVIKLAPQIDQLTQNLIKFLPPMTEFLINLTSLGQVGLGTGFQSDIEGWKEQLKTAQSEVDNLRSAVKQLESPSSPSQPKVLEELNSQLLLAEKNVIRLRRQFQMNTKLGQLGGAIQTPTLDPVVSVGIDEDALSKAAEAADRLAGEKFKAGIDAMNAQAKEAEKLRESLVDIRIEQLGWSQDVVESLRTPIEVIKDYRKELDAALERGDLTLEQHAQAYQKFADDILGANDKIKDNLDLTAEFTKQAYANMQDSAAGFFEDVLNNDLNTWDDYVQSFTSSLNSMVANYLAQMAMMKAFGAAGSSGGSALGSLAQLGLGLAASFSGAPSGLNSASAWESLGRSGIGGFRADGGPVAANVPYVVGEKGPELFMPNAAGNVIANDKLGGTTYNENIVVHMNVSAMDARSFNGYVMQNKEAIAGALSAARSNNTRGTR